MVKLHTRILVSFVLFSIKHTDGQDQTLLFTGSNPSSPPGFNLPTGNQQCTCVPQGSCQRFSSSSPLIDIRIVNMGTFCTPGFEYCCDGTGGNVIDGTCGLRKIPATPQPTGQASYGAYPWQAALLTTSNNYIGSGVLINSNHVLTVAHKVAAYRNGGFKVRLGEWDARSTTEQYPYQEYQVARLFIHPNFNSQNLQNDVAVIRLASNVPISSSPNINTACLPNSMPSPQTRCWVSGWGKNAFGSSGSYQSIMKEVDVPILSQTTCETQLRGTRLGQFFVLDRNSFLCAGGEMGKDACTGDGGSPLVCQNGFGAFQVVGMVAWGIGCATAGVPGIYINVVNFLSWINQQVTQMV
ncbi:phenoloxidase-activating factor 2 [Cephus cinctus]|uniref:Phenoloxidase-activating factor 2 n=1 Tax=Cephus cinctus TaxID=211228 RepID=A0AAJ7FMN4_CEPCN|nr:phenoloxidase-activating factor 2 [Cephus cinctus]